jgi:hypothetical protein
MDMMTRFVIPGIALLLTLVFGFWLSNAGKPYNGLLFNVHKLIALGAVVLTAVQLYKALKGMEPETLIIMLILVAGLCVAASFITGALMSIRKGANDLLRVIHNVAPVLVIIAMAATIYLLAGRQL